MPSRPEVGSHMNPGFTRESTQTSAIQPNRGGFNAESITYIRVDVNPHPKDSA